MIRIHLFYFPCYFTNCLLTSLIILSTLKDTARWWGRCDRGGGAATTSVSMWVCWGGGGRGVDNRGSGERCSHGVGEGSDWEGCCFVSGRGLIGGGWGRATCDSRREGGGWLMGWTVGNRCSGGGGMGGGVEWWGLWQQRSHRSARLHKGLWGEAERRVGGVFKGVFFFSS